MRFVQLYTWYTTPSGKRQFCVVEKTGSQIVRPNAGGTKTVYQVTDVKLVEPLNPNPINYKTEDFWALVDAGKLVEFVPGVTQFSQEQPVANAPVPWRNDTLFESDYH